MSYGLVIVDMQPQFEAAECDKTAKNIIKLIKKAKEDQAEIMLLEYAGFGPTRPDILAALGDEDEYMSARKIDDDGSDLVYGCICTTNTIKVCGVNYGACVARTASGLVDKGYIVEVKKSACNQPEEWENNEWYDDQFSKKNVTKKLKQDGVKVVR